MNSSHIILPGVGAFNIAMKNLKKLKIIKIIQYCAKKNKPILMHGFQSYPTKIEDTNLDNIKSLKKYFGNNCHYGFQDHISGNSRYNLYLSLVSLGQGIQSYHL